MFSKEAKVMLSRDCLQFLAPSCPNFRCHFRLTHDCLSQAKMLKSESRLHAKIQESLHVLRLGRVGAANFRRKVEDERARASFEEASGSSKAYKLFTKELEETRKREVSRYAALRFKSSGASFQKRPLASRRRVSRSAPAARPRREGGIRRFRQPHFVDSSRPRSGARPSQRLVRARSYPPQSRGNRRY